MVYRVDGCFGINTVGSMSKLIAEFLGLANAKKLNSHAFHCTYTMLANAASDLREAWKTWFT